MILLASCVFLEIAKAVSVATTRATFNFCFFQNLNPGILTLATRGALFEFAAFVVAICVLTFLLMFFLYRKADPDVESTSKWIKAALLLFGLALAFFHQSSPKDLGLFASRYVRMRSSLRSYAECLGKDLVVEGVKFCSVDATKLRASPGRNLVFIYLESFENALTEERLFPGLTPNIAGLRKEGVDFTNVHMAPNSHYSYGGMYSSLFGCNQTGLEFFGLLSGLEGRNRAEQYGEGLVSLPLILRKSGYSQSYVSASDPYGDGVGQLLGFLKFDSIKIGTSRERMLDGLWGNSCNDGELFDLAFDEYRRLSKAGGLSISPFSP